MQVATELALHGAYYLYQKDSEMIELSKKDVSELDNDGVCLLATYDYRRLKDTNLNQWDSGAKYKKYVTEAKKRRLSCGVSDANTKTETYVKPKEVKNKIPKMKPNSTAWTAKIRKYIRGQTN